MKCEFCGTRLKAHSDGRKNKHVEFCSIMKSKGVDLIAEGKAVVEVLEMFNIPNTNSNRFAFNKILEDAGRGITHDKKIMAEMGNTCPHCGKVYKLHAHSLRKHVILCGKMEDEIKRAGDIAYTLEICQAVGEPHAWPQQKAIKEIGKRLGVEIKTKPSYIYTPLEGDGHLCVSCGIRKSEIKGDKCIDCKTYHRMYNTCQPLNLPL